MSILNPGTASPYRKAETIVAINAVMETLAADPAINPYRHPAQSLTLIANSQMQRTHSNGELWERTGKPGSKRHHAVAAFLQYQAAANQPEGCDYLLRPNFPEKYQRRKPTFHDMEPALTYSPNEYRLIKAYRERFYGFAKPGKLRFRHDPKNGVVSLKRKDLTLAQAALIADPDGQLHPAIKTLFADAVIYPQRASGFYQTIHNDATEQPEAALRTAVTEIAIRVNLQNAFVKSRHEAADGIEIDHIYQPKIYGHIALRPLGPVAYLDHRTQEFRNGLRYGLVAREHIAWYAWAPHLSASVKIDAEPKEKQVRIREINNRLKTASTQTQQKLLAELNKQYQRHPEYYQYCIRTDRCNGEIQTEFGSRIPEPVVQAITANLPHYAGVKMIYQAAPNPMAALPWDPPENIIIEPTLAIKHTANTQGNTPKVIPTTTSRYRYQGDSPLNYIVHQPPKQLARRSRKAARTENAIMSLLRMEGWSITETGLKKLCKTLSNPAK